MISRVKVPGTSLYVARMALGAAMLGVGWTDSKLAEILETGFDHGLNFIDVADVYGDGRAESVVGRVLKQSSRTREDIVLQTKCGDRFSTTGGPDLTGTHILASVEQSLQRLGTDYLDLLLLHWPDDLVEPEEVAAVFDMLHDTGKVRYFGVSNHSPFQIQILERHVRQPLVVNQIRLGLANWLGGEDPVRLRLTHDAAPVSTLDYCRARGRQVQAYSPLRGSRFSINATLVPDSPWLDPASSSLARRLVEIGEAHDVTPGVVMLAWLLRHPAQIVPVIGASAPARVVENAGADAVRLTRSEWHDLLSLATAVEFSGSSEGRV